MATETKTDIELPWWQQALLLGFVSALFIGFIVIYGAIFPTSPDEARRRAISGCGGSNWNYDVSCPDPEDEYDPRDDYTPGY